MTDKKKCPKCKKIKTEYEFYNIIPKRLGYGHISLVCNLCFSEKETKRLIDIGKILKCYSCEEWKYKEDFVKKTLFQKLVNPGKQHCIECKEDYERGIALMNKKID